MTEVIIREKKHVNETAINDLDSGIYIGFLPRSGVKVLLIKAYGRCCAVDLNSPMGDLSEEFGLRSWGEDSFDAKTSSFTNYKQIKITKIEGEEISE